MASTVFPAPSGGVTQKVQEFLSTGTFTAPSNCTTVELFMVGGGGGGGWGQTTASSNAGALGGGGGGGQVIQRKITVTSGQSYTVTIGSGGSGASSFVNGGDGGDSSFGSLATVLGGAGGASQNSSNATTVPTRTKGTGAGASTTSQTNYYSFAGAGGGAGGNSFVLTNDSNGYGNHIGSRIYIGLVGAGSGTYSASGNQTSCMAGIGIDGYGTGGSGGVHASDSTWNSSYGPLPVAFIYGATSNVSVAGTAGANNTGNGGGGGAALSSGTVIAASGAAGGSGYCRVTYWS